MTDDLIALLGAYTLTIREERGSWGTYPSDSPDRRLSVAVTVVAESPGTRLTGDGRHTGDAREGLDNIRARALAAALADVAGQADALVKHRGYRS